MHSVELRIFIIHWIIMSFVTLCCVCLSGYSSFPLLICYIYYFCFFEFLYFNFIQITYLFCYDFIILSSCLAISVYPSLYLPVRPFIHLALFDINFMVSAWGFSIKSYHNTNDQSIFNLLSLANNIWFCSL